LAVIRSSDSADDGLDVGVAHAIQPRQVDLTEVAEGCITWKRIEQRSVSYATSK
jgi:hypothetical protein